MRTRIFIITCCISVLLAQTALNAEPHYNEQFYVPIQAKSAVLIEESTGKVLYSKDDNFRVFPASITKVLTVIVVLDYFALDELVVAGDEITSIPGDSSRAFNEIGEVMTVENMIRLIIIPSGNETSCVAAAAVAARVTGNYELPYAEAERIFCELMNKKAREIGAVNSFFVNPHGYHHNDHYTTAYDMALICREALGIPFLRQVIAERAFTGYAAPPLPDNSRFVVWHEYTTRNELMLPDNVNYYPYATGIKTGMTGPAGECLAASATKDGKNLIAVIFDSPNGGRWLDARNLFDFGFNHFNFETVHEPGVVIDTVYISNAKLGEEETLNILTTGTYTDFFTENDLNDITTEIIYLESILTKERDKNPEREDIFDETQFTAPITEGEVVGSIIYSLNGEAFYEAELIAETAFEERTKQSDREYYKQVFRDNVFTARALPYWSTLFVIIFLLVQLILYIRRKRNRKRYLFGSRYYIR